MTTETTVKSSDVDAVIAEGQRAMEERAKAQAKACMDAINGALDASGFRLIAVPHIDDDGRISATVRLAPR